MPHHTAASGSNMLTMTNLGAMTPSLRETAFLSTRGVAVLKKGIKAVAASKFDNFSDHMLTMM